MANYYPDESGMPMMGKTEKPETESEEYAGNDTSLIPKAMVGDAKPGDIVKLEVVRILEDQVEVCPADEKGEKIEPPTDEQEIDDLATED